MAGRVRAKSDRFAMVPEWVVKYDWTPTAFRLYCVMAVTWTNRKTRKCWPSVATMAKEARMAAPTVKKALLELQKAGAIEVTERYLASGRQISSMYELADAKPFENRERLLVRIAPKGTVMPFQEEDPWEADPDLAGVAVQRPLRVIAPIPKLESGEPEEPLPKGFLPRSFTEGLAVQLCTELADARAARWPDGSRSFVSLAWVTAMVEVLEGSTSAPPRTADQIRDLITGVLHDIRPRRGFNWATVLTPPQMVKNWDKMAVAVAQARSQAEADGEFGPLLQLVARKGRTASYDEIAALGVFLQKVVAEMGGWNTICSSPSATLSQRLHDAGVRVRGIR